MCNSVSTSWNLINVLSLIFNNILRHSATTLIRYLSLQRITYLECNEILWSLSEVRSRPVKIFPLHSNCQLTTKISQSNTPRVSKLLERWTDKHRSKDEYRQPNTVFALIDLRPLQCPHLRPSHTNIATNHPDYPTKLA